MMKPLLFVLRCWLSALIFGACVLLILATLEGMFRLLGCGVTLLLLFVVALSSVFYLVGKNRDWDIK